MLAFMPAQSSNSSPGTSALCPALDPPLIYTTGLNYWYGSGSLPDSLEGLPQGSANPRLMRRASETVGQAQEIQM
jgi:hypothetical protein